MQTEPSNHRDPTRYEEKTRFVREGGVPVLEQLAPKAGERVVSIARPWCPWYFPRLGEYARLLEDTGFVVRSSSWFPRPSPMPDSEGQSGIVAWLQIFASSLLDAVPSAQRAAFTSLVEREARAKLFRDGVWLIDYVRLRVEATRPPA